MKSSPTLHQIAGRLHSRFCFVMLLALLLGVALLREILGGIAAVRNSYASLSAYRLEDTLEAPIALGLVSATLLRIANGQFAEAWQNWDQAGVATQLAD